MTIYADRETGACDLFRRCCINRRATKNKKENALPELKKEKRKKIKESETNRCLKKNKRKKIWRSYAHRNNKACDLFKMCVDPEPRVSEAPSNK